MRFKSVPRLAVTEPNVAFAPKKLVEEALVAVEFVAKKLVEVPEVLVKNPAKRLVDEAFVAKRLVVVAFVVVEFVAVNVWSVVDDVTKRLVDVAPPAMVSPPPAVLFPIVEEARTWRLERRPTEVRDEETTFDARVVPVSDPAGAEPVIFPVTFPVAVVKKRLVVLAVVAKKAVVVAFVVVANVAVNDWSVVELLASMVFAAKMPNVALVAKRLVEEAFVAVPFVAKKAVVVAFTPVKFCNVLDAFARMVFATKVPTVALVAKRFVEDAVVNVPFAAKSAVEVAFVEVELSAVKF